MDNRLYILYTRAQDASPNKSPIVHKAPSQFERPLSGDLRSGSSRLEDRPDGLEARNTQNFSPSEALFKRQRSFIFKPFLEVNHEFRKVKKSRLRGQLVPFKCG
jgi:hypothetical protein